MAFYYNTESWLSVLELGKLANFCVFSQSDVKTMIYVRSFPGQQHSAWASCPDVHCFCVTVPYKVNSPHHPSIALIIAMMTGWNKLKYSLYKQALWSSKRVLKNPHNWFVHAALTYLALASGAGWFGHMPCVSAEAGDACRVLACLPNVIRQVVSQAGVCDAARATFALCYCRVLAHQRGAN